MSINGQVIKLKSIDSCEAKYFKVKKTVRQNVYNWCIFSLSPVSFLLNLAKTSMTCPCSASNRKKIIFCRFFAIPFRTECVSVLNKCKAADEGRTSLAICQMIGSTSVYNQCWNLSAFSTPPAGGVKEINVSVALVLRGVPWTPLLQFDASPIFRNLSRNVEFNVHRR